MHIALYNLHFTSLPVALSTPPIGHISLYGKSLHGNGVNPSVDDQDPVTSDVTWFLLTMHSNGDIWGYPFQPDHDRGYPLLTRSASHWPGFLVCCQRDIEGTVATVATVAVATHRK